MALKFITPAPSALLAAFKKGIDDKKIVTWSYDSDGDFTHNTDQWRNKAWLRPIIKNGQLAFGTLKPKNSTVTWEIYGVYHGRMIESMIVHCHDLFSEGTASAQPTADDKLS